MKTVSKSLLGKKPVHKGVNNKKKRVLQNPGRIANKLKRSEMYGKYLTQKRQEKAERRKESLGEFVAKPEPKTIDSTREREATLVHPQDAEILLDEHDDEFADYFRVTPTDESEEDEEESEEEDSEDDTDHGDKPKPTRTAKILVTTRPHPSRPTFFFIADLLRLLPHAEYWPRRDFTVPQVCAAAIQQKFTHAIILSETKKKVHGLTVCHLATPEGPTAHFRVSNVVTRQDIPKAGKSTSHIPEFHIHNFKTRLGVRIGRLLASLFPVTQPDYRGRQVVTIHNQRDFLFVRQHRYAFRETAAKSAKKEMTKDDDEAKDDTKKKELNVRAKLQELGPRFTLKLKWLQEGVFSKYGEYEWFEKRKEMETSRRRFHL